MVTNLKLCGLVSCTSSLGVVCFTLCTRLQKGWTCRLVPMTISRSHSSKSTSASSLNLCGRSSPNSTMSGFTTPSEQESQAGTWSALMAANTWCSTLQLTDKDWDVVRVLLPFSFFHLCCTSSCSLHCCKSLLEMFHEPLPRDLSESLPFSQDHQYSME